MRCLLAASMLLSAAATHPAPGAPPRSFHGSGSDRRAIRSLLDTYVRAVSTGDEALFETLLLDRSIPFSSAALAVANAARPGGSANYEDFRGGAFGGPRFTQRFRDVRISLDGPLADVSLVFVNTAAGGTSWGWKTMQLLKVGGRWRIASEFYTGHPLRGGANR